MSVGFFSNIGKIVIYLRFFLIIVQKCVILTILNKKQHPTLISQLFMLSTFENFLGIFTWLFLLESWQKCKNK